MTLVSLAAKYPVALKNKKPTAATINTKPKSSKIIIFSKGVLLFDYLLVA
jgi:hypothetical protein